MNLPKRVIRNSDSSNCSTAFCAVCSVRLDATWDEVLNTWDCIHSCEGKVVGVVNKGSESDAIALAEKESKDRVLVECSWCGEPLNGKKKYGNRIHPDELFCSRSHRDASTAAVKDFREKC